MKLVSKSLWMVLILAGVAVLVLALSVYFLSPPGRRLHVENFSSIRRGMTQAQVEELLGGPPGDYGSGDPRSGEMTLEAFSAPEAVVELIWTDDDNRFEVWFDKDGNVAGAHKRAGFHRRAASWRDFLSLFGF